MIEFPVYTSTYLCVGTQGNFDKMSWDVVTTFGQPYDFGSVMHYGAYAFSANGERTIITLVYNC